MPLWLRPLPASEVEARKTTIDVKLKKFIAIENKAKKKWYSWPIRKDLYIGPINKINIRRTILIALGFHPSALYRRNISNTIEEASFMYLDEDYSASVKNTVSFLAVATYSRAQRTR